MQDYEGYSSDDKNLEKNKRFRRNAHEIQRFYKCTVKSCEKSYGSEGSLNQHYKLKHPEIYIMLPNVQNGNEDNGEPEEIEESKTKRKQVCKGKEN